tara:strand:+ start:16761 stop:20651 length:3891 start_codon:yes stop_codon:yes gene_type:complete
MLKALLLFALTLFALSIGSAQEKFRFKNYTINDGLSQSSVTTIIQDDLNALWIGTQDGLNKYDGNSFEVFTSDKTEGLESEFINCSFKDKKGSLWFGTDKGLTHYSIITEKFTTYFLDNKLKGQINDIVADADGNLWVATVESGLFMFDTSSKTFISHFKMLPVLKTKNIAISDKGFLIITTANKGVFIANLFLKKAEEVENNLFSTSVINYNCIVLTENNTAVLGTNKGLLNLKIKEKTISVKFDYLNRKKGLQNVSDVFFQENVGWLITTNDNGLFIIKNNGKIQHSTEDIFQKNALIFNELNLIFKDNSGVFWLGSQRGISNFNPLNNGILGVGANGNPEKGIPTPSVWCFEESLNQKYIYIGLDKGISRLNKKTGSYKQFYRKKKSINNGTGEMTVLAMKVIDNNNILVACADGLFKLKILENSYLFEPIITRGVNDSKHNRTYSIVYWKDNLYWVGTKDGVLLYDNSTNKLTAFEHEYNNNDKTISKGVCRLVHKDNNNRVWFTTSTGGLNLLSESNGLLEIRPYAFNFKIKEATSEYIASIFHEKEGVYWFGTLGAGLVRWDERTKATKTFNKTNGLPNDVIYGIIGGKKGDVWMSTNKGLSKFNLESGKIKNFTEVDGLMSNEFNLGAHMKSKEGLLYFGGIYGYNFFDPSILTSTTKQISVVFTKFKLVGTNEKANKALKIKPVFLLNELSLSYKQRSFSIKFQAVDISNPDILNYKYHLEGSDEGEILIGSQNEIYFNSLAHGEYDLVVHARLGGGPWSVSPARIKVIIAPPFWFTWSFWTILLLFLAVLTRFIIKKRVADARREQVLLEIKINERTREIKQQNKKIAQQKKNLELERNKVVKQQKQLQLEKDKTERLLLNIIPKSTAEELKKKGKARARSYKKVSVLFTDFIGFSKISDEMSAAELVKKLDVYFTKFDEIIVKNNLEKIKTIGDAYMCAGGVPVRNITNPIDTVTAGLQIQNYMQRRKNDAIANSRGYWELRLGINTGEVTAGVIGSERLAYDIWGATVNRAQRMEMFGQPGKVTITGATYQFIEPYFECRYSGKTETKNKEMIEMYVVERIKPELSKKGEGIEPNDKFQQIVNLHHYSSINYYKAERHIVNVLEQQLSENLHYHSIAHTKDVVNAVERLALAENVTDEGLFLLKSAATYHDAGFVEQYDKNESVGARMAEEILPMYGYTEEHILKIKELIYVTEIPHKPKNKLEEIICDADLDYLGRDDFHKISARLCKELIEHGKVDNEKHWDTIQIQFLKTHTYFTKTAKRTRGKKKLLNLQEVKNRLEKDNY